ncbi:hypothetical protein Poly30_11020 [Planctomycetes bacterium Poly30]|uniref:SbsA Ig-like domain-containing protein n=1 Tax=Saltatorellus ferox TaxID=2528018 RepID=A0A518ENE9_9BACT|nr:hypothetical protein Poly30_11020 [Planctomycetes bacterium Poly30]
MRTTPTFGRTAAQSRSSFLTAALAAGLAASLAGCSSSSDGDGGDGGGGAPDTTAPAANSFVQDRTTDPTGMTVVVGFSEAVTPATAEVTTAYTITGAVVQTATLNTAGTAVTLTLDAPAIPGDDTIAIAAGIEDAAGNMSTQVNATAIATTDTTAPNASAIEGITISGPENDQIVVTFTDDMIASEVETSGNWNLESPLGTPFDATGSTVVYDVMTRTATLTLGSGSVDQNLHTFDDIHASFIGMRDLGGNQITTTSIGTSAVNGMVTGDTEPPVLLAAAPGTGNTLKLTFSESVTAMETTDLKSVSLTNGTDIVLTDANDPGLAATGTIGLTGTVADGESITISDGATSAVFEFEYGAQGTIAISGQPNDADDVVISDGVLSIAFEFDSNASAVGTAVVIGVDPAETISNLLTEIGSSGLALTASPGGSSTEITLLNAGAGAAGNVALMGTDTAGVQTLTGMTSGGVTGTNVPVMVNTSSVSATVTNLRSAIDNNAFNITTSNGAAPEDFILTNDNPGTAGNVPISEFDTLGFIDFTGMAGGTGTGLATYAPTASTAVGSDITSTVTFSIAPEAADSLRVYGVTDLAGNQMIPETAATVVAASAAEPALTGLDLTGSSVAGEGNDSITFAFVAPVHPDGVTDPANYTLTDTVPVDLTGAEFRYDMTLGQVEVSFNGASSPSLGASGLLELTVDNLRSLQGVVQSAPDLEIGPTLGDTTAPTVGVSDARLDPADSSSVFIIFSEAISPTGGADEANYTITGNTTSSATLVTPRVAHVTFASAVTVSDTVDIAVAAATDLAGNAASGVASVAVSAADAAVPTVSTVIATNGTSTGRDTIKIVFSEPVARTSSEMAANYAITSGGVAVDLTDATVWSSSVDDSVTIELPASIALQTGDTVSVTPSNITDVPGNALVSAASMASVAGDSSAPSTAAAFVNVKNDIAEMTVDVQFSESMDATVTGNAANWSASGGQVASSVTRLNERLFRVTFDGPISPADTIDVATPTDRAGNVGGTMTINPAE